MKKVIYSIFLLLAFSCSDDQDSPNEDSFGPNDSGSQLPSIPVLTSPSNGSDVVANTNQEVSFTWQPSTGNLHPEYPYRITVDDDPNFNSSILLNIDTNSVNISLPQGGVTYYWRVLSTGTNGQSQGFSPVWSFNLIDQNASPTIPQLESPSDQSTISLTSNNTPVTFSWFPSTDPNNDLNQYRIEISKFQDFNIINYTNLIADTNIDYIIQDLGLSYYWRVKAIDTNGNESSWSDIWEVYIEDGTVPSQPQLLYPLNEENCQSANLTLDWEDSTDPNGLPISYELVISDTPVFTASAQLFSTNVSEYTINLNSGQAYYWRVTATNGNSSSSSDIFSFYAQGIGSGNTVPFLTQRAPASGTVTSNSFINLELQAGDAETSLEDLSIDIYFGTDPNNLPDVVDGSDGNIFNVQVQMPTLNTYYWKIHITDTDGATYVSQIWNITRE